MGLASQSENRSGPGGLEGSFWHPAKTAEKKGHREYMFMFCMYIVSVHFLIQTRKSNTGHVR